MSKNIIYVFTGSGNCLDIAKNIARGLGDTDIVLMRKYPAITNTAGAERVGFVVPCHGGGLPGGVEDYVRNIHITPGTYTFGVVSYSGYPGNGLGRIHSIVGLDYAAGISHQCGCIWLLPHGAMVPPLSPTKAQKRSEELAAKVAADVKAFTKSDKAPKENLLNAVENAAWPKLAVKKASKFSVTGKCVGCGQCAKLCPRGNIAMIAGRPNFGTDCIQCLSCVQYCPRKAINLGGVTVVRPRYHNKNVPAKELMEKVIHID